MTTQKWDDVIEQAKRYKGRIYGIDIVLRANFCRVFRLSLKECDLTQVAVARGLKKTPATIQNWLKGITCPTWQTMIQIRNFMEKKRRSRRESKESVRL